MRTSRVRLPEYVCVTIGYLSTSQWKCPIVVILIIFRLRCVEYHSRICPKVERNGNLSTTELLFCSADRKIKAHDVMLIVFE